MTLHNLLTATISQSGPLPLSTYMALCLTHPEFGYYTSPTRGRDPIGAGGDFITAPEISQMFGELIGLWAVHEWQSRGAANPFSIVEFGPGHGTLMADALRAASLRPAFIQAMQLFLIEASPKLRTQQMQKLGPLTPDYISDMTALPAQPAFIIANEFFDAMPIDQYRLTDDGWQQRAVDFDGEALVWAELPATPPALVEATRSREWIEHSAVASLVMQDICTHIKDNTGAALLIDYGYLGPQPGDTLQAVQRHAYVDVLAQPGDCDLTAHVDFGTLARIAHAAGCHAEYMTQGEFLNMLGIGARAEQLGDAEGLARLTETGQMGDLFKVLVVSAQ